LEPTKTLVSSVYFCFFQLCKFSNVNWSSKIYALTNALTR